MKIAEDCELLETCMYNFISKGPTQLCRIRTTTATIIGTTFARVLYLTYITQ